MRFGPVPLDEAQGAILAHSVRVASGRLRKGQVLNRDQVIALRAAGLDEVIVARSDPDDIPENEAAGQLAAALVPDAEQAGVRISAPFTGRVNILAAGPGVVRLDVATLERFNRVHPMITVATVPDYQQMAAGGMVATIKVIAFAVPARDVDRAVALAVASVSGAVRLAMPVFKSAGLVVTDIPGGPPNDKGIRAIRGRLAGLDMELGELTVVAHQTGVLAAAISEVAGDLVMILTGSATMDAQDVAPSALRRAGGRVERFGMPVDPGNLLFLGDLAGRPVIGLPGCARSPALNGADWVLSRVACGIPVSGDDIAAMGVGGLLKEIPSRPQPRAGNRG